MLNGSKSDNENHVCENFQTLKPTAQPIISMKGRRGENSVYKEDPLLEEACAILLQRVWRGNHARQKTADDQMAKYTRQGTSISLSASNALGQYSKQFMVVCNKPECDENYLNKDWCGRSSMSKNHRFLIRKDIHWQYFNGLVFGLADASISEAIKETRIMLDAAQTFVKESARTLGWSGNCGYYFHIYGHNSVNSLHLHIVDLDHTGPTYDHAVYKNIPVEEVIKALEAEAVGQILPGARARYYEPDDPVPEGQKLKSELVKRYPKLNDAADLQLVRKTLRNLGGAEAIRQELISGRFLTEDASMLTTGTNPFNVFARLAYQDERNRKLKENVVQTVFTPAKPTLKTLKSMISNA